MRRAAMRAAHLAAMLLMRAVLTADDARSEQRCDSESGDGELHRSGSVEELPIEGVRHVSGITFSMMEDGHSWPSHREMQAA